MSRFSRLYGPVTLEDGDDVVVSAYEGSILSMIAGTGATITYSQVDDSDASSHDSDTQDTVAAGNEVNVDVVWPLYRVSVSGGSCRVALV